MSGRKSYHLHSPRETEILAWNLADTWGNLVQKASLQIALCGNLGAGKTLFAKSVIFRLSGVQDASSPTFSLCHEYIIPAHASFRQVKIEHWDLYRLSQPMPELHEISNSNTLRLIEWADKFDEIYKDVDIVLRFSIKGPEARCLEIFGQKSQ